MTVHTMGFITAATAAVFLAAGCASTPSAKYDAVASLTPASGSKVSGSVSFRVIPGGVHIDVAIAGLPQGAHGFHIHEVGDCSAADATSAKGHFNPYGKLHGDYDRGEHHAGDMLNLISDADGKATFSMDLRGLAVGSGEADLLGRAVIIHADPDDYTTQPAGNSGKRIACGVITAG